MRKLPITIAALLALAAQPASATGCGLTPKQVVTRFMTEFYVRKEVRKAFETWVDPGYIQHNPMAATGRDAAIGFLEPFFAGNPDIHYEIKRIIADGDLVAVHSRGSFSARDRGVAVVDILRVKDCKVMEHWDVVQPVPETSANTNGMF
ncbi:Predicted SnoaL-like aldol condensation-catalyzing enzyme [Novosphingobium sp. CF614]|uniref:nuclear transport factor 2 family protein n=1 Tax=Novosphingobium sp. CF614 TaxID=1884364 RepID=UPI0008EDB809|nr:nuclear transport factor 2 family protein [Novosphingobium sp. CF614]SFG44466.1 Predicted SnoaL-like aldol condensation-catalyzing enzyme [Novosphingobium sp. CF614]